MTEPSLEKVDKITALRTAAKSLRDWSTTPIENEDTILAIADWLDAEAVVLGELGPFAEVINATVTHATGTETFLRFGKDEHGNPKMWGDTSQAAVKVAALLLEEEL